MEYARKAVHVGSVLFALLIGRVPPLGISFLALAALFFNAFILPRMTSRYLERDSERKLGFSIGILAYPLGLFILSLLFFEHQVFVAIGWGMMAFGDGFAGLFGTIFLHQKNGASAWPWNPKKTRLGSLSFLCLGPVFTFLLLSLLPPETLLGLTLGYWFLILCLTSLIAAWVETLVGMIDDNLSVPFTAAFIAWFCWKAIQTGIPPIPELNQWYLYILGLGAVSFFSRKMTGAGATVGMLLATCILIGTGPLGLTLLGVFFVLGTLSSQVGYNWKSKQGLAQDHGGKRSVRHAIANGIVPATGGLLCYFFPRDFSVLAVAGSLAAATSDTLSSELGNRYGRFFFDIISLKPSTRGQDGVVSPLGTFAGMIGSFLIALIVALWGFPLNASLLVFAAGILGNLGDSILGATLQRWGYMTNDSVNFFMTLIGFLTVWILGSNLVF